MKKKNNVKPTRLQRAALEIMRANPDMPKGEAMVKAGYSKKTALAPGQNLLERKGTEVAIEQFKEKLAGLGINTEMMAQKYQEWVTATKIKSSMTEPDRVVPDYETQLKVKDDINKALGINLPAQDQGNLKKRIIAEEFFQS